MVRIRFRRVGLKRQPSYRIVVADKRSPRDGRFIEIIGHHNPRTRPSTDVIDEARALYWLSVGAQPSESVKRLMQRTGTWRRFERYRKGESVEKLVEEAQTELEQAEPVSPRTRYPSPGEGESKQKAGAEAVEATVVAETVETEAAAVEAEEEDAAVATVAEAAEAEVAAVVEPEAEEAPPTETVAEVEGEDVTAEAEDDETAETEETEEDEAEETEDAGGKE